MTPQEYDRIIDAANHWIITRESQGQTSADGGRAQEGTRSQVTGGAHLDGINDLIVAEIEATGARDLEFRTNRRATLAGWYRSAKSWDLLVFQRDDPILAVEYKSMSGSEGKNLNNRADEVFGMAEDAREAERHGVLPRNLRRAYVYLMEVTPQVTKPVSAVRPIPYGRPDIIFRNASYLDRVGIMCERMRDSGLFHLTWALGVHRNPTDIEEPNPQVNWDRFAADLQSGFKRGEATEPPHP